MASLETLKNPQSLLFSLKIGEDTTEILRTVGEIDNWVIDHLADRIITHLKKTLRSPVEIIELSAAIITPEGGRLPVDLDPIFTTEQHDQLMRALHTPYAGDTPATMLRYNEGKPRPALVPHMAYAIFEQQNLPQNMLADLIDVYTFGSKKYDDNNWRKGGSWLKVLDSAMRHVIFGLQAGEDVDPESGLPHLAHITWNIITLMYFDRYDLGKKDTLSLENLMVVHPPNDFAKSLRMTLAAFADSGDVNFLELSLTLIGDHYRERS